MIGLMDTEMKIIVVAIVIAVICLTVAAVRWLSKR
ncbi:hypothetical protein M2168_001286 [Streptomyces sp. CZ24]|nr:hypothetical protein [Streptomyces sp. CZ24]